MTSHCSTSCRTGGHATWGDCVRAKGLRVAYCQSAAGRDYSRQKAWDRELAGYRDARAQGIQPDGTTTAKIRQALDYSDKTGTAYDGKGPAHLRTIDG
jgi:hypothetical protein